MESKDHHIMENTTQPTAGAKDFFTIQPDVSGRTNITWTVQSLCNHCWFLMPYQHLRKKNEPDKST